MKGFSWERLGAAAANAAALTLVITLGQLLIDREFEPVTIGAMWLGATIMAYVLWPAIGANALVQLPFNLKQVALSVFAGLAGVLAARFIPEVTGWNALLTVILLVAVVMAIGSGVSRWRAHGAQRQ